MNLSFRKGMARAAMPLPSGDNPAGGETSRRPVTGTGASADPAHENRSDIGAVKTPHWKGQWRLIRYL